jgi:hypothetical protein
VTRDSRPLPPPSWPKVIATTLRLWLERHVLPARPKTGRPAPGHPGAHIRRRLVVTVLAIVVIGAAMTAEALLLTGHGSASAKSRGGTPLTSASSLAHSSSSPAAGSHPATAALATATATRDQAAAWVARQVSHGVIVACDPLMCAALHQRGFPAADLAQITAASRDPLGSGIVVSTLAVRSQLGHRLATVYAPVVLATFGSAAALVQVREVAVGGTASYLASLRRDLRARKAAGIQLSHNSGIVAPRAARAELQAGRVDSRLLITLAALAHRFRVRIRSFGDGAPGATGLVPLRQVVVTAPSKRYLSRLLGFLRAQRPPLLAAIAQHRHGGQTAVQIQYTAPSPIGLLGTSASR